MRVYLISEVSMTLKESVFNSRLAGENVLVFSDRDLTGELGYPVYTAYDPSVWYECSTVDTVYLDTSPTNPFIAQGMALAQCGAELVLIRTRDLMCPEVYVLWLSLERPPVHTPYFEETIVYGGVANRPLPVTLLTLPRAPLKGVPTGIGVVYDASQGDNPLMTHHKYYYDFVIAADTTSYAHYIASGGTLPVYTVDGITFSPPQTLYMAKLYTDIVRKTPHETQIVVIDPNNIGFSTQFAPGFATPNSTIVFQGANSD